jgi:hypothetical protein
MGLVEGHSTEGVGKILSGFSMVFPMGFSYDIYIYILYRKNHRKTHGIAIFPTVFAIFFPVKTNPMVSLSFYPTVYKDLIQFCPI